MGERLLGVEEVRGSIPLSSIYSYPSPKINGEIMLGKSVKAIIVTFLLLTLTIMVSCGPKGRVIIGMVGPETGKYAYLSMGVYDGITLHLNKLIEGKLKYTKGYAINLVHYDDDNDPELALKHIKTLLTKDHAACIVMTSTDASVVKQAAELCSQHEVPFFSLSGALPKGKSAPYVYEMLDDSERSREMFLDWIMVNRPTSNFLLVETAVDELGVGFAYNHEHTTSYIESRGGTVLDTLSYGEVDLLDVVYDISHTPEADAVLYFGPVEFLLKLCDRMLAKGISIPVYYLAPYDESNISKEDAPLLFNTTMFSYLSAASTEPMMSTFIDTYYRAYGRYPSYRSALSYEVVNILSRALRLASTDEYKTVAHTLENLESKPGIFHETPPKGLLLEQTIYIEGVEMDTINNVPKFIIYDTVKG